MIVNYEVGSGQNLVSKTSTELPKAKATLPSTGRSSPTAIYKPGSYKLCTTVKKGCAALITQLRSEYCLKLAAVGKDTSDLCNNNSEAPDHKKQPCFYQKQVELVSKCRHARKYLIPEFFTADEIIKENIT